MNPRPCRKCGHPTRTASGVCGLCATATRRELANAFTLCQVADCARYANHKGDHGTATGRRWANA